MKVEKIDHIHIYVNDLDETTRFFADLLATRFDLITPPEELNIKSTVSPLGIELIAPTSPTSDVAKAIAKRGEGLAAISLKVPNLEEAVAEMKSRGFRQIGKVQLGTLKEAQFHPKDAHGVMIELCEYEERHGAIPAILERE